MSGNEEKKEDGMYMIRRKWYVPKEEHNRDYRSFDKKPANFVFDSDFEDEGNDEDKIQWEKPKFSRRWLHD